MCCYHDATAEITQDGSLVGTAGQNVLPSINGTYQLDESQGQLNGTNLLFSFENFNVLTGENAHFSANNPITNVISRVTGGTASTIDGTISSSIVGADVWLINPSGLVFGENAQINVLGSFHASTANNLIFDDDSVLSTDIEASPNLSIASPVSFGFLAESTSKLTVNGSQFSLGEGEKLTLASHQIEIDNLNLTNVDLDVNFLSATDSEGLAYVDAVYKTLVYSAVGSSLSISNSDFSLLSSDQDALNLASETINLDNVLIDVTSESADVHPEINVFGTDINIFGFSTITGGAAFDGGLGTDINLVACEALDIYGESLVKTESFNGQSTGGNIFVVGQSISIRDGASIESNASFFEGSSASAINDEPEFTELDNAVIDDTAGAQSGSIVIVSEEALVLDDATVATIAQGLSQGALIRIDAGSISMNEGAVISIEVLDESTGSNIDISVGDLLIENSATISMELGAEGGGDILITANDIILTTEANIYTSTFEEGDGGNMYLDVNVLEITDQATIEISESRIAVINADQSISVIAPQDGSTTGIISGDLILNSPQRNISNGSTVIATNSLSSDALLLGSDSNISITADLLDVLDDAISSSDALISSNESKTEDAEKDISSIPTKQSLRKTELLSKSCHVKELTDRSSFVVSRNASSVYAAPNGYQLSHNPALERKPLLQETSATLAMIDPTSNCL